MFHACRLAATACPARSRAAFTLARASRASVNSSAVVSPRCSARCSAIALRATGWSAMRGIAHARYADLLDAHHAPDRAARHRQAAAAERDAAEQSRAEADRAKREGTPSGCQVTVPPRPP